MNKKSLFVKYVELVLQTSDGMDLLAEFTDEEQNAITLYFESLKKETSESGVGKGTFTKNGEAIMQFLSANKDTRQFSAIEIANGMGISAKAVSGALRKLVTDGFVEKMGKDPVVYSLIEQETEAEAATNES